MMGIAGEFMSLHQYARICFNLIFMKKMAMILKLQREKTTHINAKGDYWY